MGMTTGPHPSAAQGAEAGWRGLLGLSGCCAGARARAGLRQLRPAKLGGLRGGWRVGLQRGLGRKGERGRGFRRLGLAFWQKGFQTSEFKFEFEFQQPK
jgi:hypothetical protein